ncbi:unnamed protein product [Lepidochelys kempii]
MASFPADPAAPGRGPGGAPQPPPPPPSPLPPAGESRQLLPTLAAAPPSPPPAAAAPAPAGSPPPAAPPRFSPEQVSCVCEALLQAGDPGRLGRFLGSLPAEPEPEPAAAAGGESLAKARALLAFQRGDFGELYRLVQSRPFAAPHHPFLQDLYLRAPLPRGRGGPGPGAGRGGQVPAAQEVPAAQHHLGRRGDGVLLQAPLAGRPARLLRPQPLPQPRAEAAPGPRHRPLAHPGQQLVQEPAAAGPQRGRRRHPQQERVGREPQHGGRVEPGAGGD